MVDELEPPPPREKTGRRMVQALGDDRLHKGMNWTTLIGVAGTAVMGYMADGNRGEQQSKLADGAAREIAALHEWRDAAKGQLSAQAEQIARLREAVAALRAANEAVAQSYGRSRTGTRIREAVEDVEQSLVEPDTVLPIDDGIADVERVRKLKESLGD